MLNEYPSGGGGGHDPQPNNEHPNYAPPQENYPQGGYPPPQGSYPQGQGAYPGNYPPPPGSYPPPPSTFATYPDQGQWAPAAPPFGPTPTVLNVGEALRYGWKKFVTNIGVWIAFMAVFAAVLIAFYIVAIVTIVAGISTTATYDTSYSVTEDDLIVPVIVVSAIAGIAGYLAAAVLTRGALLELDGAKPGFGAFWRLRNVGNIILVAVVVALVSGVINGLVNPFVSLVSSVLLGLLVWFALHFIVDRGVSAIDSVVANARLIASSPGPLALLFLALAGINIAGSLLCGLGLIVTVPMSVIATTYAYRVLSGGAVSPA